MLYDKNPLSNYTKVQKVWIDGSQYFDRDNDVSGRATAEVKKKSLVDKEKESERRNAPPAKKAGGAGRPQ